MQSAERQEGEDEGPAGLCQVGESGVFGFDRYVHQRPEATPSSVFVTLLTFSLSIFRQGEPGVHLYVVGLGVLNRILNGYVNVGLIGVSFLLCLEVSKGLDGEFAGLLITDSADSGG